jgi:hypothetical protein
LSRAIFCEEEHSRDNLFFVRLASCLLLELTVGLTMCGAAISGVWFGVSALSTSLTQHEAAAATQMRSEQPEVAVSVPKALVVEPVAPVGLSIDPQDNNVRSDPASLVFGVTDADALAPMRNSPVSAMKLNHGGTSLSIRIDFASGARASFKPLQIHDQSEPRREIAAYRLDRLLGLGHVPAAISVGFPMADLIAAAKPAARGVVRRRLGDEANATGDMLFGEISWWVPEIVNAKVGKWRIDENDGIDLWRDELRPSSEMTQEHADIVRQISQMIVFDFVVDNADRWTGSNTKSSPDGKLLYFMDNTLSFSKFTQGHLKNRTYLQRVGRFSRDLVARLRALTPTQLTETMGHRDVDDQVGALLTDIEVAALLARRDFVISYIDKLIATHGESNVLVFP